ncbi:dnaJ homolog subfamily C member 4 isoform X14 [Eschrichtius robustus]|uniref:dnaJ homolog subfamily C member 4 isoform X14 n=1 Tax=Eschrichtius robustus TaxID=9764 RepID=UPI0035C210E5
MCGGGASPLVRTFRPVGVVWVSQPMRVWTRGLNRSRKRRPPRGPCPPAFMLPLRLRRLWPHSPPTRFFAAAARQRSGPSNYYELLGVHPGASAEEVKRAFFSKSKELHPDRDPRNPALHSCFVELSEAYQVLSHEQSRRSYDHQLRSAASPKCPGTTAHPRSAHQAHSSSWAPPNAKYWAQFHEVRPQGPESRQQQHKHNRRVLGYCLLVMLAGMGLHYVAFRKLEQMHRSFMDEKDRIITAIYNDTRARARCSPLQGQQSQGPGGATAGAAAAATTRASSRPRDRAPRPQPLSGSPWRAHLGWGLRCAPFWDTPLPKTRAIK